MNKILVIEDDQYVRENLVELLKAEDYFSIGASNGEEGFLLAKRIIPDLILCDILMPGLDGYATLIRFREDQQTASIPFIFLTARTEREDLRRGMELGADDYITKPFSRSDVLKAISTRLRANKKITREAQIREDNLRDKVLRLFPERLITDIDMVLSLSDRLIKENETLLPQEIFDLGSGINKRGLNLFRMLHNYILLYEVDEIYLNPVRLKKTRESEIDSYDVINDFSLAKARLEEREKDIVIDLINLRLKIQEAHLEKILDELLDNAFKFSSAGKAVEVTGKLSNNGEIYLLSIKDFGRGFPKSKLQAMTNPVSKWHDSSGQENNGFGIILVNRYLDLYGGTLLIDSEEGKYTKVTLSLPVAN
jgi:two-component system, sensor histidine kinase and response regulator